MFQLNDKLKITTSNMFARANEFTSITREIIFKDENNSYIFGVSGEMIPKNKIIKIEKI